MQDLQLFQDLPFQVLDVAIIIIILISAIFAYIRGFVHEILSITGWIGAILATFFGLPFFQPYVQSFLGGNQQSSIYELAVDFGIGFVIFILTLVFLSFLSRSISRRIQKSILSSLDRALGFLFGIIRGSFFVCLLFLLLEAFWIPKDKPNWLTTAKSLGLVAKGAELIRLAIPENIDENSFFDFGQKARKNTKDFLDASRAVNSLISPKPKGNNENVEGVYGKKERLDLERLIDSNQEKSGEIGTPKK